MHHTQSQTGTKDVTYNLISVIYHALQGAETYSQYVHDAEQSGDNDTARFFREILQEEQRRAERAKDMLQQRLGQDKMR